MKTSQTKTGNTPAANSSDVVVFDSSSGISLEEQQEILDGINAMTAKNTLATQLPEAKAKKKGILFPVLVNVAAVLLLASGFFALSRFHFHEEQNIRQASATLGITERALIQEIRQETSRLVLEKESEINNVLLLLSAAIDEQMFLQDSFGVLTTAQQQRVSDLVRIQEQYRSILSGLQDERVRLIEDSHAREIFIRSQAEQQARELAAGNEQQQAHLAAAMEDLRRLSAEQDLAARAESQMSAFYLLANGHIGDGRFDQASATLAAMREFLNAPSLAGNRTAQVMRPAHLAAISALEEAVARQRHLSESIAGLAGGQPTPGAQGDALAQLQQSHAALEQQLAAQALMISAFDASGNEHLQLITEHVNTIAELRAENEQLASVSATQAATLTQQMGQIQSLNSDMAAATAQAQQSERELQEVTQRANNLQFQYDDLQRRLEAALGLFQ